MVGKLKFSKKDGLDDGIWTRMKIGLEVLFLLKSSANAVDRKNAHNPKGLIRHFDILDDFHDARIKQYQFILGLKKQIFGKDFLDECIMIAVEIYKKCDIDLTAYLNMVSTSKQLSLKE